MSIAIPLPDARGAGPQLSLSYSTGAGNGPFGLGFALTPPVVERQTARSLPQYRSDDTFVLTGHEDLVPVLGDDGEPAATERTLFGHSFRVVRYQPRIESGFSRIEQWRGAAEVGTFWRVTSADNVTSYFGRSDASRVADPGDRTRVFRWLLDRVEDDRGNVTEYVYKSEDREGVRGVWESGRPTEGLPQKYLKRIRYGNRTPAVDPGSALTADDYCFEVVFDYGEHGQRPPLDEPISESLAVSYDDVEPWSLREDSFSNFRPGFDLRTHRRCQRVLVFHRFAELGDAPVLTRSVDLYYDASPVTSLLTAATYRGYARNEDGTYRAEAVPPTRMGYTSAEIQADGGEVQDVANLGRRPLDGAALRLVDLDGEGAPGLLDTSGGRAWTYRRAEGGGRFAGAKSIGNMPTAGLSTARLLDVDGGGTLALANFGGQTPGSHPRTEEGWGRRRTMARAPRVDLDDPNVKMLDLTGDGRADLLLDRGDTFAWYRSLGHDGFAAPKFIGKPGDERRRPPQFVYRGRGFTMFHADMTGDGLSDLVRVDPRGVAYWPNLGYGKFGPRVVLGDAVQFGRDGEFSAHNVRLADIDGSGTADVIIFDDKGAFVCINAAGNRLLPPQRLRGVPRLTSHAFAEVADVDGLGVGALVWSSATGAGPKFRIVRLLSEKPYLLNQIDNGFGGETRIGYASSSKFYRADRNAGRPWLTKLPFPVQVVERVETYDRTTGHRFVSTYAYHHGYYDGAEREFRGFGMVEQRDTETFEEFSEPRLFASGHRVEDEALHVPPVLTRAWFHLGHHVGRDRVSRRFADEYWSADADAEPLVASVLPDGLSALEWREALRALKGSPLRVEVFAEDGSGHADNPYTVAETNFMVRREQGATDKGTHAVFSVHPQQALTHHYERNPADPRVTHELVLEVDELGVPTRTASVAYPRRSATRPEQGTAAVVLSQVSVTHQPFADDRHRIGSPVEQWSWELTGVEPAGDRFTLDELRAAFELEAVPFEVDQPDSASTPIDAWPAVPGDPRRRLLGRARTLYWGDDLSGSLPLGEVGLRALPFDSRAAVLSEAQRSAVFGEDVSAGLLGSVAEAGYILDDGLWWSQSPRATLDPAHFYRTTAITDPFGGQTSVSYDSSSLFVIAATDPVGNTTTVDLDYRVLAPREAVDPNGNVTRASFDLLGTVTAVAAVGKPGVDNGDSLEAPTLRHEYDRWSAYRGDGPVWSRAIQREHHADSETRWHSTTTYSDGLGRVAQQKVQVEPGPDGAPRWLGTGRTVVDNKGNPIKQYEPFFSAMEGFESEAEVVEHGVTPLLHYDPLGRLIQTDLPDGSFVRVDFTPWEQLAYDAGDTVMDSRWRAARLGADTDQYEQRARELSERYANTPTVSHLDTLGRPFEVDAHNRFERDGETIDEHAVTRTRTDISGNVTHVIDARGNVAQAQVYGMAGQALTSHAHDVGTRRAVTNVLGQPLRAIDDRGHTHRFDYDAARRPTHAWVSGIDGADGELLTVRTVYGESLPADEAVAANLRGAVWRVYDGAGVATAVAFDFDGNPIEQQRQLVVDPTSTADWSALVELSGREDLDSAAAGQLEAEDFTTRARFNALGEVAEQTTPDGSIKRHTYNDAFLLRAVAVERRGAESTAVVSDITYDEHRRRSSVSHGNGTRTTYDYDPLTFRLTRLHTTRPASGGTEAVQDLRYHYDIAGNVTDIRDEAQQAVFFGNTVVEPHQAFEYDAHYRLITATGREHVSQGQPTHAEHPTGPLPNPNDPQALRRYTEHYRYDAVGNILQLRHEAVGGNWTRRYRYDELGNRLLATSAPADPAEQHSHVYTYNAHGSMTAMPHLAAIDWDHAEQMRHIDLVGGGDVWFVYDASGTRVRKVHENQTGSTRTERIYLGDLEIYREHVGGELRRERQTLHVADDTGRVCMFETLTVDGGAARPDAAAIVRHQYGNHLGSTALELDGDARLISYEEFHPYGTTAYRAANSEVEVSPSRYRYTGQERDEETGLGHHGARYYAAWLGRWTAADPIGLGDGVNRYQYSQGRPVTLFDPFGTLAAPAQQSVHRFDPVKVTKGEDNRQGFGRALYETFGERGLTEQEANALAYGGAIRRGDKDFKFNNIPARRFFDRDSTYSPAIAASDFEELADVLGTEAVDAPVEREFVGSAKGPSTEETQRLEGYAAKLEVLDIAMSVGGFGSVAKAGLVAALKAKTKKKLAQEASDAGARRASRETAENIGGQTAKAGDDFVTVYHGTSAEGAASIRAGGIDPRHFRPNKDFGAGFYTTTSLGQAAEWVARRHPGGEILTFQIPRAELEALRTLQLSGRKGLAERFIGHFRKGGREHLYDAVDGPMLLNLRDWRKGASAVLGGQQLSFHTPRGFRILERSLLQ